MYLCVESIVAVQGAGTTTAALPLNQRHINLIAPPSLPTVNTPSLLIVGHVLGCQFPGVLPSGTPPDCSLPTYLVNATFPNPWGPSGAAKAWLPPSCVPNAAVGWKETKMSVKVRRGGSGCMFLGRQAKRNPFCFLNTKHHEQI